MSFDAPLLRIRAAVRILKGEFQMKQYQKPEVFYENFVLAEHIALCANKLGYNDIAVCTVTDGREVDDGCFYRGEQQLRSENEFLLLYQQHALLDAL